MVNRNVSDEINKFVSIIGWCLVVFGMVPLRGVLSRSRVELRMRLGVNLKIGAGSWTPVTAQRRFNPLITESGIVGRSRWERNFPVQLDPILTAKSSGLSHRMVVETAVEKKVGGDERISQRRFEKNP
jgi:hypothetical protein